MKRLLLAIALVGLVFSTADAQQKYRRRISTTNVIFFDNFVGSSIDATKWIVYDRIGDLVGGEVGCMVSANTSVSGGLFSGVSKFEDHTCSGTIESSQTMHYTSWEMSQKGAAFLYGTIEARMKLPGGTGIWPAFWMLGYQWQASQPFTANTPEHNWPVDGWGEIDIAEFLNNARTSVNNQVHYQTASRGPGSASIPFDATSRFMVYRLQWTAGSLIWSVDAEDGVGFRTTGTTTGAAVPNIPMYVVLSAQMGGVGGGTPNSSTFPQTFQVDYVRVTK